MGRISPGPTRWPPGAERRLVPAKSNLKPQTSNPSAEFSFFRPPRGYASQHTHQYQPYSSMPPQAHRYCAERRHLQGLHPRHFDDRGNFDPTVILRWPEDEELPKVKPVGILLWGMAFAEVSDDPAPSPVDNSTTFNQFWATTGPGAYGHQATPHLDPTSLGDLQRANLCSRWDGKGEPVHHYLLNWRIWERSVGRALDAEARIAEILASVPPKFAGPFEDRHLRRCLSYKEVKEEVEWEARNKTNVYLFRDTYKSTVVPAHCTASQLRGVFADFCYWARRVRGGVTLEDASKDWLDVLRLHSDLTLMVIAEQTKCGQSFEYVRLHLFVQVYFLQQEKPMSTWLICGGGTRGSR